MATKIQGENLTGDGSTAVASFAGDGSVHLVATGSFGGGTLTLEYSPDGETTWVPTTVTLSDSGEGRKNLPAGPVRATLAGATSPDIDVWILPDNPRLL